MILVSGHFTARKAILSGYPRSSLYAAEGAPPRIPGESLAYPSDGWALRDVDRGDVVGCAAAVLVHPPWLVVQGDPREDRCRLYCNLPEPVIAACRRVTLESHARIMRGELPHELVDDASVDHHIRIIQLQGIAVYTCCYRCELTLVSGLPCLQTGAELRV